MVSLLKNQIFKHLSRYTKNLSPDKINLSTFKGEGELTSLELDEIVLTDLLELPSWVRLTSARCNKVDFRIHWTKVHEEPIRIALDEVKVEIETCEELRSLSAQQGLSSYAGTDYNFAKKVVDGMTISVNIVIVTFRTPAFTATVEIMRILVESKSPDWKKVKLKKTRKKDKSKQHVLIFKTIECQALKLEANSTVDKGLDPLRLLTNKSKCRLTIKKRTSDCFVMGCKLLLMLEDLIWILTDSQLKAVFHFVESLSGLVQKANEITRVKKAARKLELLPEYHAQISQQARSGEPEKEQAFAACDVIETSYHFVAQKIDLHLIDDAEAGRSMHPILSKGSVLHLVANHLQVDYYPYHLAAANRTHWARYNEANSPHVQWLDSAQSLFKNALLDLVEHRGKHMNSRNHNSNEDEDDNRSIESSSPSHREVKQYLTKNLAKVMTSCIILRVQDFIVYTVGTNNKSIPKEFIKGDKERIMPSDVTVHAEFTYYYYPGDIDFPLPPPKFYVQVNPVVLNFDANTVLWLNSFALNLHQSLIDSQQDSVNYNYIDVKIEAIMPRIIFESNVEIQCGQRDRPKSLQIQISRALVSNFRSSDGCSRADLAKCVNASQLGSLFFGNEFPSKECDFPVIPEKFNDHVQFNDNIRVPPEELPTTSIEELNSKLHKTLLWTEARDVWCINLEPVWGEFYGARGVAHNKPVAFLDSFPLKVWVHMNADSSTLKDPLKPDIHALAYISNLVSVQINHYQLLFLLRLSDELAELVTILGMDSRRIVNGGSSTLVVGAVIPQLEFTLVMPSQTPGKESSGADLESVIPDSSSLADDVVTNPSIQWNTVLTVDLQDGGVYKKDNTTLAASPPSNQLSMDMRLDIGPELSDSSKQLNSFMKLSSVKKGLSNFTSLIDSKLKFSPNDVSDSISIRSDCTSDSLPSNGHVDSMFNFEECDEAIEYGSEALEDYDEHSGATMSVTTPSENPSNASSYKRKDLISVATFKLGQVEVVQQSQGFTSTVKAQVSNIAIEECPAIPWDEFQNKFNTRCRGWAEVCDKPAVKPGIRLRKDHTVNLGDLNQLSTQKITSWFEDMITAAFSNIHISLNSSTISSIAEFFEDDVASPSIPIQVNLENTEFNIIEERNTVGSSGTPINISISRLYISRGKDGIFLIEPTIPPQVPLPTTQELLDLKNENEQLRRRLVAMERLNEENHRLRKCEEESQELRSCLHSAQDALSAVLEEKQRLTEIVRTFQLSKVETKQQSSGKR